MVKILILLLSFFVFSCEKSTKKQITGITKSKFPACKKHDDLKKMIQFAQEKKYLKSREFVDSKKCTILTSGILTEVLQAPGLYGKDVQFKMKGRTWWSLGGALKYKSNKKTRFDL